MQAGVAFVPSAKSNHPKAGLVAERPTRRHGRPCGAHPRGHLLTRCHGPGYVCGLRPPSVISRIFILVFNARLHRASPACGFTIENLMNLFAVPPASFQLGCIFLLSETMVVLLGVFLVKGFPDLVYASIARSRVATVGMNPSGLQILQKATQIGGLAVGCAPIP